MRMRCKECGFEVGIMDYGDCPECGKVRPWTVAREGLHGLLVAFAKRKGWTGDRTLPMWLKINGHLNEWVRLEERLTDFSMTVPPKPMFRKLLVQHFLSLWPGWNEMDLVQREDFLRDHIELFELAKGYADYWEAKGYSKGKKIPPAGPKIFDPNAARAADKEMIRKIEEAGATVASYAQSGDR